LSIIGASFLLGRKDTLFVASASAILYGSLLDLQFYGYLPVVGGISMPAALDGAQVFYAVFVHVVAFLLVGILSGTVAERLKKSEQALQRRKIDYEELENLNKTILENINSGLMIINPAGRIRSFNAAASRISGYRLEDVYDRPVNEIFPNLDLYDGKLHVVGRGEGRFVDLRGRLRNLGYSTSLVKDLNGEILGLLMTFQDLTHLKEMEQKLQRADRLAAVGRLASGMAHEIRNPLASISGSVQLLMETGDPSTEDRQLMRIVVREADRLGVLLTDFLNFARPKPPSFEDVDVSRLLDELCRMVSSDNRFAQVELRKDYTDGLVMRVDRTQLRQALWNLLINAAEAIPGQGVVELDADPSQDLIAVHDSGPGVPQENLGKIFDPFFTTRETGTGLGLATVYAIVEKHGGDVQIGRSHLGGACFSIRFPAGT
ncbi:MAG TPA: ATP-binding protein, partial [Desulfuromonadales bacterium]|nr:ATP-binding protein [Desulfuromonadales bacterium]